MAASLSVSAASREAPTWATWVARTKHVEMVPDELVGTSSLKEVSKSSRDELRNEESDVHGAHGVDARDATDPLNQLDQLG